MTFNLHEEIEKIINEEVANGRIGENIDTNTTDKIASRISLMIENIYEPKGTWENMKGSTLMTNTMRLRVKKGWIYRTITRDKEEKQTSSSMCFVPD
jgi:hypothetical protein